jgi:putative phage-type endonuclease
MRIHSCVQGTTEWLQLRAGIPTASQFDMILTPGGKPSKSAERYLYTLLAERLIGHPIVEHVSMWMSRGSQMEAEAVAFYELQRDCEARPVGFITNDEGTIGASPDRLVGDSGLLEIKVPSEYIHMQYLMHAGSAYEAYKVQVQGQLMVSGRQWTDVLSWHPELPEALVRIERDPAFILLLGTAVIAFSRVLEEQYAQCIDRGWASAHRVAPQPQSKPSPFGSLAPLEELLKSANSAVGQQPDLAL